MACAQRRVGGLVSRPGRPCAIIDAIQMKPWPNDQGIEMTGAQGKGARGASFQSVVEPARRMSVKPFSLADCFLRHPVASSTYENLAWFPHRWPCLQSPSNGSIMTDHNRSVQTNSAANSGAGLTSAEHLTPELRNRRQARRAAAGFNQSPEPLALRLQAAPQVGGGSAR